MLASIARSARGRRPMNRSITAARADVEQGPRHGAHYGASSNFLDAARMPPALETAGRPKSSLAPMEPLASLLLVSLWATPQGPVSAGEPLRVARAAGAIAIDGDLGDPGWAGAAVM